MGETREIRLKRLGIRSWRRGTREMDLILGPFADRALAGLDDASLDDYETLLAEADRDLYAWIAGKAEPAPGLRPIVERVRSFHHIG